MQKVINFPKQKEKIRLLSLFSGIGAFEKAFDRLGLEYELVNYCEIDKYASKAYSLIHGTKESLNLGDITKADETKISDIDLITYGFPCQDISIAGNQKGIIEGETRSGLLYDALRILKYKRPKYAIAENVKNLVSKKFRSDFEKLQEELDSYGYNNYWAVINAKDFGIPQNRERVFVVSIRKDVDDGSFKFPEGFKNGIKPLDTMENEAEEKYYLSERSIESLEKHNEKHQEKGNGFIWKVRDLHSHASTIRANGALAATDDTVAVPARLGDILEYEIDEKYYIGPEIEDRLVKELDESNDSDEDSNKGVVLACITPDRVVKRQNGRRFKRDGEPMFTVTS
ncbi:DNA cytosine methyltransferase [Anaerosolibacter sp.]|uniref:DNA cytosine methyltransferase n=1 Tax=Anaerosolibacter sp. TaxID=1872527 RepID=UPI0039EF324F